jgi:hypothetical protein
VTTNVRGLPLQGKMKLDLNPKNMNFGIKPRITKGYYAGQLVSIDEYQKDEQPVIKVPAKGPKYRQLIFRFKVFKYDSETKKIKEVVQFKNPETGDNVDVELSLFVTYLYERENGWDSALTPKSRLTQYLTYLGWTYDAKNPKFDTETVIGKYCELNIDDYTKLDENKKPLKDDKGNEVKFSVIKDLNTLEGVNATVKTETANEIDTIDLENEIINIESQKAILKEQLDAGLITQKGYELAVEKLKNV